MARITADDYAKGMEELTTSGNDRNVGIIAAALVEATLEDAIVSRLLPMSNTHRNALFGGENDFASFSAKIDLGFSLGLYGQRVKTELHHIRRVRNEFAHHPARDFSHPDIMKHVGELTPNTPETELTEHEEKDAINHMGEGKYRRWDMRTKFLLTALALGSNLYKEMFENKSQPTETVFLRD